jgi:hypothetical protein
MSGSAAEEVPIPMGVDDLAVGKRFLAAFRRRGSAISGSLGGLAIPPQGEE